MTQLETDTWSVKAINDLEALLSLCRRPDVARSCLLLANDSLNGMSSPVPAVQHTIAAARLEIARLLTRPV